MSREIDFSTVSSASPREQTESWFSRAVIFKMLPSPRENTEIFVAFVCSGCL